MQLVRRVKAILTRPQSEWRVIAAEPGDPIDLLTGYVAALALVPAVAGFVGSVVIGAGLPNGAVMRLPVLAALFGAIFGYVLTFVVVYLVALLITALAPSFGGRREGDGALKLAVYSFTPYWLAGVVLLLPGLRILAVLGLYGAYLIWTGASPVLQMPRGRALPFALAIGVAAVALTLLVGGVEAVLFTVAPKRM